MYRRLLRRVEEEQARSGASPQPSCSPEQLHRLRRRVDAELHAELPAGYGDLLEQTNGLDWNGVVIYASEETSIVGRPGRQIAGFVEANLGFRDDPRFADLLVLGSDGTDLFTYRVTGGGYQIYDEVPHEAVADGLSFTDLMTRVLTRSLS